MRAMRPPGTHTCPICIYTARNAGGLGSHMRKHRVDEVEEVRTQTVQTESEPRPESLEVVPPVDPRTVCDLCPFVAKSAGGLKVHKRKHDRERVAPVNAPVEEMQTVQTQIVQTESEPRPESLEVVPDRERMAPVTAPLQAVPESSIPPHDAERVYRCGKGCGLSSRKAGSIAKHEKACLGSEEANRDRERAMRVRQRQRTECEFECPHKNRGCPASYTTQRGATRHGNSCTFGPNNP